MNEEQPEVVRWYTLARKFPTLIGKTPDGKRLPGGPYTQTQIITAGVLLFLGYRTMHVWARFGILGNYAVLLLGTWAVMWSLGKVPLGARNPVKVASGVGRALLAPRTGRVGGRPVRIRGPHRIQHSVSVRTIPVVRPTELPAHGRGEVSVAVGSPSLDSHPRTSAQGSPRSVTRRPALSGVQLLLAHGVSSRNAHQEH